MRSIFASFFLLAICFSTAINAQEIYLNITGPNGQIKGEAMAQGYRDNVEALSFAQGSSANCTSSQGGSGVGGCVANTGNLFFVINLEKAVNPLRQIMYRGQAISRMDVSFVKMMSGQPVLYQTVRLDESYIVSITDAVSAGGGTNTIQIEVKPGKVGWTYIPPGPGPGATPVKFGWDHMMNREWTSF